MFVIKTDTIDYNYLKYGCTFKFESLHVHITRLVKFLLFSKNENYVR